MPMTLGDIAESSYSDFTLKYYIPSGVTSFQTTVYSSCAGSGGTDYYYPAKRDFYSYNQANQLTEILNHDGETTAFSYDAGGAITEEATGPETTTYSYSGLDRLTGVTTPATTINYAYDALGRRITRSEDGYERKLIYGAASDLYDHELDTGGNLTASMLKGPDGLISTTDYSSQEPVTNYYLYNPHGDTTAIANEAGTVTSTYRYDSFGSELNGDSPDYGYTGKWQRSYDSVAQTIQMGAREYDPALGRFTSVDPLKGDPTRPQSRNRYPYGLNDPLTMYDLDGRFAEVVPVIVIGGVVVIAVLASNETTSAASEEAISDIWEGIENTGSNIGAGLEGFGGLYGQSEYELYSRHRCLVPPPNDQTHWGPDMPIAGDDIASGTSLYGAKVVNKDGGRTARDSDFNDLKKGEKESIHQVTKVKPIGCLMEHLWAEETEKMERQQLILIFLDRAIKNGNILSEMSQKIKKITNRKDLAGLEKAYKSIFRSASTTNDPFQPEIERRAILFYHPYVLDEKYLRAIGQSANEVGDSNIAYVSLIEGFSGNDFNNRYHWLIDLMNYPYEKLRKDEDWFPIMENAIYSKKGIWGIIFSEVGYAILGGSKQFFCALQKNVPNLDEEVYDFLKYMKERIEKSPKTVAIIKSWLPSLLTEIYGLNEAEKMLEQVEFNSMLEAL